MIDFLILDYNRPVESEQCLKSIKHFAKFEHRVIYFSNGGDQNYVLSFYHQGLIDKLILNSENNGGGFGTTQLIKNADSPFAIYVQCDQYLQRDFKEEELNYLIENISNPNESRVPIIGLAGDPCGGIYSERAQILNVAWYNKWMEKSPNGGPGPFCHKQHNENYLQQLYKEFNFNWLAYGAVLFGDNGCYSRRVNPDLSEWEHRTDTKELKLIKGPIKERYMYPKFNDAEWEEVLKNQSWTENRIPENEKAHSFKFWK